MENKTHKGNYKGTNHMEAENQDMAFVNDTLENDPAENAKAGAIGKREEN
ncbi:hypothetical protein ACFQWB_10640 [Paenibacillus thermoaerophilus]|uniref:YfhD-like protein n=1 Tax=Paenibacillus thermoaerophilus TaxID=1215385 RepID=A0ABW2V4F6_9BACL|nr:hypothetical protein [Paenibacillus thermoaerophilus]